MQMIYCLIIFQTLIFALFGQTCNGDHVSNSCRIPAPFNETFECQSGYINSIGSPPQLVNCLTTGCSINTFAQVGFMCFCKGVSNGLRFDGNQIFLTDGSCCPVNQGWWVLNPVVSDYSTSGFDAQCQSVSNPEVVIVEAVDAFENGSAWGLLGLIGLIGLLVPCLTFIVFIFYWCCHEKETLQFATFDTKDSCVIPISEETPP
jgi:hypothetical protein